MELGAGGRSIWRPEVSRSFNPAAHGGNRRGDVVRRVPAPGFGARRRRGSSIGAVAAAMAGPAAVSSPSLSPSRSYLSPSRSFFRRCRRKARFFPRAPIRPRGSAQGVCRARLPDARTPSAQGVRLPR